MEAKDTLMSNKQLIELRKLCESPVFKAGQEPDGEIAFMAVDTTRLYRKIAQAQAEISFKAGIREVVEWVKKGTIMQRMDRDSRFFTANKETILFGLPYKEWQAKLKEWGD